MSVCLPEGPAMRTPSESTVTEAGCVMEALLAIDRELEKALARVASEARQILWRDNLTDFYKTSADPKEEMKLFRAERRRVSAYARSVSFQGTGYGIDMTHCEPDLNLNPAGAAAVVKRALIRLSLVLLTGAVICALAYRSIGVQVEANGTLRDAFALIPIGYLLSGAGIVTGIAGLLWRKPARRR